MCMGGRAPLSLSRGHVNLSLGLPLRLSAVCKHVSVLTVEGIPSCIPADTWQLMKKSGPAKFPIRLLT